MVVSATVSARNTEVIKNFTNNILKNMRFMEAVKAVESVVRYLEAEVLQT